MPELWEPWAYNMLGLSAKFSVTISEAKTRDISKRKQKEPSLCFLAWMLFCNSKAVSNHYNKKLHSGAQWDSSAQNPWWKERQTPKSCPLTSTSTLWHMYVHTIINLIKTVNRRYCKKQKLKTACVTKIICTIINMLKQIEKIHKNVYQLVVNYSYPNFILEVSNILNYNVEFSQIRN